MQKIWSVADLLTLICYVETHTMIPNNFVYLST
jgi:hypothetical protein